MYTHDIVLRLVERIYDAALNPREWAKFTALLGETIEGHSIGLWNVDSRHDLRGFTAVSRFDPEALDEYYRGYVAFDPWISALTTKSLWRDGFVGLGEAAVPQSQLRKTQFYNDLGRRYGLIGGFGAICITESSTMGLTANQTKPGQFAEAEVRLVLALMPHLRRALTMNQRLTRLETLQTATVDAIDRVPACVILVDHSGRPHTVNRAARLLLARCDGLQSTRDGLAADLAADTTRLRTLIHEAIATTNGHGLGAGGELALSRRSLKRPLHVVVSPLRRNNEYGEGGAFACAAVFVHDPDEGATMNSESLRRLYGLTGAEARVAAMLAEGATVKEIGGRLGVSNNTVRTHLKRLLAKTGTNTQAQLVRAMMTSLATLVQPGMERASTKE